MARHTFPSVVLAFTLIGCPAQPDPATSDVTDPGPPQTTGPGPMPTTGTGGNPDGTETGIDETSTSTSTSGETSTGETSTDSGLGTSTSTSTSGETSTSGAECELTLDVLFMVARSAGMLEHQQKLRDGAAGFFATLTDAATLDVRVMVTDIDRSFGAAQCEDTACKESDTCAPDDPSYLCAHSPTECDALYGASVVYPYGIGAANMDCGFSPFLESIEPAALDCALTMGEGTSSVDFGQTLGGVLGATNEPCNGGFVRDGAKLAIILLSDTDDTSFTRPPDWIAKTLAARPKESLAIIALTGEDTSKIDTFVASFPYTVTGAIADAAYGDTLTQGATMLLDSFCPG